ncbi:MAG: DUF4271 domain-containing protein [Saprospiraceae bacterium]
MSHSLTILPNEKIIKAQIANTLDTTKSSQKGIFTDTTLSTVNPDYINPFDVDHRPIKRTKENSGETKAIAYSSNSSGFILWVLIFISGLLAIILNIQSKYLGLAMKSILNENILKLLKRDEQGKHLLYHILLYGIYILSLSVFIYLILETNYNLKGFKIFGGLVLGFTVFYILKHSLLSIIGYIFSISKNTSLYNFTIMLFNQLVGILLIPIDFFMAFGPDDSFQIITYLGFGCLGFFLVMRSIRGLLSLTEFFFHRFFQIIVYLCAFEIAPILILLKYLEFFSLN